MRSFITWTLLALCLSLAHATSIVALIESNRVLLAADSRTMPGDFTTSQKEDTCKIIRFSNAAFADSGISSTAHKDDTSIAWDAQSLARTVYANTARTYLTLHLNGLNAPYHTGLRSFLTK
jgi:hypothetical protein